MSYIICQMVTKAQAERMTGKTGTRKKTETGAKKTTGKKIKPGAVSKLAKKIRKPGEDWPVAMRRAAAQLKKG